MSVAVQNCELLAIARSTDGIALNNNVFVVLGDSNVGVMMVVVMTDAKIVVVLGRQRHFRRFHRSVRTASRQPESRRW